MQQDKIKFVRKAKRQKKTVGVLTILFVICITYVVVFNTYTLITGKKYLSIGNSSFVCVQDNMMEPEIKKNDLVITRKTKEINEGDNICYTYNNDTLISKVVKVNMEDTEKYITKTNQGYYLNNYEIEDKNVIGKVSCRIGLLGKIMHVLQSKITAVIFILILAIIFLYNKYIQRKNVERKRKIRSTK